MATFTKLVGKNGRVTWKATVRRKGMARAVCQTFTRRADAAEWATKLEAQTERAVEMSEAEAYRLSLADAVDRYMAAYRGKDVSRRQRLAFWVKLYGKRALGEVRPVDIRAGKVRLREGSALVGNGKGKRRELDRERSAATVNRYTNALSALMRWAMEELDLPDNPCRKVRQETETGKRDRILSADEQSRLVEACRASSWERLYLLVLLALTTGARRGELRRLRYADVDFTRQTVTFLETKNGDDRTVPLTADVVAELKRLPRPIRDDALVFGSPTMREHPHYIEQPFEFDKPWRAALETAGIEGLTFHGLRHTAVTRLTNATRRGDAMRVAKFVGHRDLRTTMRYYHPEADDQRDLAAALADSMKKPS